MRPGLDQPFSICTASMPDTNTRTNASSLTIKETIMYKKQRATIEKLDLADRDVWLNFIDTGRIENFTLDEEFLNRCTKISDSFQSKPNLCIKIKLAGIKVGIRNIGDSAIESSSMFVRVTFYQLVNATVFFFRFRGGTYLFPSNLFRFFGHLDL